MSRSSRTVTPATPAVDATPATPAVDATPATPATPAVDATPATPAVDVVSAFSSAWDAAIALRDTATGAIPTAGVDSVAVAYRAIPSGKRGSAMATASAATMATAASDPLKMDVAAMQAAGVLMAALAAVGTKAAVSAVPVVSPRDSFRDAYAALLGARAMLRATVDLSDSDRQSATDEATAIVDAAMADGGELPESILGRAVDALSVAVGRSSTKGNRAPRTPGAPRAPRTPGGPVRDLGVMIRDAVAASSDGFLTIGDTKKTIGSTGGAVDNRHAKNNVDGVSATIRDGKKVFVLA